MCVWLLKTALMCEHLKADGRFASLVLRPLSYVKEVSLTSGRSPDGAAICT